MRKHVTQNQNLSPGLIIILIKIGRGLSLLSLRGAILASTPHQETPVFRFNESSFDSPGRGRCLRNMRIIKNSFANYKAKMEPRVGLVPEVLAARPSRMASVKNSLHFFR